MNHQDNSTPLSSQSCQACRIDAPKVLDDEAARLLSQLSNWEIRENQSIPQLQKNYAFKSFVEALEFTNQIGALAEHENHHPAILTEWGSVVLRWWTHKIKGLHQNDFVCAAKSDEIYHQLTSKDSE